MVPISDSLTNSSDDAPEQKKRQNNLEEPYRPRMAATHSLGAALLLCIRRVRSGTRVSGSAPVAIELECLRPQKREEEQAGIEIEGDLEADLLCPHGCD